MTSSIGKTASLLLACGLIAGLAGSTAPRTSNTSPWVSDFYVGYMASTYPPSAIDFSSLTHVMVFSVLPQADGTLDTRLFLDATTGPALARDIAQRAHAAGKRAVLVIGGTGTAPQFEGATNALNRPAFVQRLTQTVTGWGFDGVDIDWEPLPAADHTAMLALIADLRAALPGLIVTADVPWLNANFALSASDTAFYPQLASVVDQMNVMTYGMADSWSGWAVWHSSAVQGEAAAYPSSVASSVRLYVGAGVPVAKLGIGVGFYGSCWNAPATAPRQAPNGSRVVASDNTISAANIANLYYSAANARYDTAADAPYLTFAWPTGPAGCTFLSYEDETSIAAKGVFARTMGVGGASIWQLNEGYNPSAADPSSLLHAVGRAFLDAAPPPVSSTSTGLASSATASVTGQRVTFTATVTGDNGTPTGSVTFVDGATALGSALLSGGRASLSTSALGVGTHAILAVYGGGAGFAPSTSPPLTQTVNPALTATMLGSSRNPSKSRWQVTFTATVSAVSPGSGIPTGSVRFYDGAALLGTVSLSASRASFKTSTLARGTHAIVAVYAGSAAYASSTSSVLTQIVR